MHTQDYVETSLSKSNPNIYIYDRIDDLKKEKKSWFIILGHQEKDFRLSIITTSVLQLRYSLLILRHRQPQIN